MSASRMPEIVFDLAQPADDAALRRIVRANAVPGAVTVTYEREPDFFRGCATLGHTWQVVVGRRSTDGEPVGLGCRALRRVFVNGEPQEIGYLSQLRVDGAYRGRWLYSHGLRYLRQLHADGAVPAYLTSITEENAAARGLLVDHPRRHFPAFHEIDQLHTLAIVVRAPKPLPPTDLVISRAAPDEAAALVDFMSTHGAAKQFSPIITIDELISPFQRCGLGIEDFVVARRGGGIIGALALWDQSAYKQTVVQAYGGLLRWTRPLLNAGAGLLGAQPLPAVGNAISAIYASCVCIANNDPATFHVLLRHAYNLAAQRRFAFLVVGLSTRDPLLAVVRRYAHITYRSRLYLVCWQDGAAFHERLDGRVPYIDVATL